MAKRRNKKRTYQTSRKSRVYTRDPLRSFLGLDLPRSTFELSSSYQSPPVKPKAPTKGRLVSTSNQTTPTTPIKPVNLFQANNTVKVSLARDICTQRQQRKEVIHAFNHAGKSGQKKQVRTPTSNLHCKG